MAVKFEKMGEGSYMLDIQGYVCPHPQMYTKKGLEKLKQGDTLEVVFDNPSSGESIAAMCQANGDQILSQEKETGKSTMRWQIRKG
ncbi:MAG: sulfurtransferase TusA family protein [Rhodocyclales bacterium]|nr:sulfurtransferase TusA family protein [Rhodocyclales bacterium]